MVRIIAYIDGFNLYFGLREAGLQKYYWLNIRTLAQKLLMLNQELIFTKYFTARIISDPNKEKRQSTYIEALETLRGYNDFELYYGRYQLSPRQCPSCGHEDQVPNEKMTDVNIATEMLLDAFADKYDKALLISADADLVPTIKAIRRKFPNKSIIVAFPPLRYSTELNNITNSSFHINRAMLSQSRFPDSVPKADGFVLERPAEWS